MFYYEEENDDELQMIKRKYQKEKLGSLDQFRVSYLHRARMNELYLYDWLNRLYYYRSGSYMSWVDEETNHECCALIRADGKVIGSIDTDEYFQDTTTKLKAKVDENGYLIGIANGTTLYTGKGRYPIYEYKD